MYVYLAVDCDLDRDAEIGRGDGAPVDRDLERALIVLSTDLYFSAGLRSWVSDNPRNIIRCRI
jgi:hypothetical protein